MVDITADATVYPSANDVAETEKEGRYATEQSHAAYAQNWLENHIVSGFALPASDPDLTISVPLGEAVIDGHRVVISGANDITLADAATNHIYLQLGLDGAGDVDTIDLISNTTGIAPVRSVKIGEAVAAAGAISSTYDSRIFHHAARVSQQFQIKPGLINISTLSTVFIRSAIARIFIPYHTKFVRMAVNINAVVAADARLRIDDANGVITTGTIYTVVLTGGASAVKVLEVDVSNPKNMRRFFPGEYLELSVEFRTDGTTSNIDDDSGLTTGPDLSAAKFFSTDGFGRD